MQVILGIRHAQSKALFWMPYSPGSRVKKFGFWAARLIESANTLKYA
jgi:hypothetical protein